MSRVTDVDIHEVAVTSTAAAAPRHGLPARTALPATVGGAVLLALAAVAHLWFAPFAIGTALGCLVALRRARTRVALGCAVAAALAVWAAPLLWRAIAGEPVVATARVVAALAGLPPIGWIVIVLTVLIAAIQGLLGAWLGTSVCRLFVRRRE